MIFSRPRDAGSDPYTVTLGADASTGRLSVRQGSVTLNLSHNAYSLTDTSPTKPSVTIGEFGGASGLTLTDGTLSSVNGAIAPGPLATGKVTVGNGGIWENSGSLFVGGSNTAVGGAGELAVETGGSVHVSAAGQRLKVWPSATLNLAGGTLGGSGDIEVWGALNLKNTSSKTGAGTLTVNGPISWASGAQLHVQGSSGGKLVLHAASGTNVSVTDDMARIIVDPGATVELAGDVSATSSEGYFVNIQNDSLASMHVTGTNQAVGNIDGVGNTTVDANKNLTVARVAQNILTIDGDINNTSALVKIRRSTGTPAGSEAQVSVVNSFELANDGATIVSPPPGGFGGAIRNYFGTLDLVNNDMIITGGSPSLFAELQDMIRAGAYTGGTSGITSSEALTTGDYQGLTYLGSVYNGFDDDNNPLTPDVRIYSEFDGVPLVGGELLVKYTWFGDADLDGQVTGLDFGQLLAGLGNSDPTNQAINPWIFGDFDYNGIVDGLDYGLLLAGIGAGGDTIPLPEPGSLVLMGFGFSLAGFMCKPLRNRVL